MKITKRIAALMSLALTIALFEAALWIDTHQDKLDYFWVLNGILLTIASTAIFIALLSVTLVDWDDWGDK